MRGKTAYAAFLAVALAACVLAGLLLPHEFTNGALGMAARLRAMGALGWVIFVAAQAAIALFGVLPASLLGVAAGAVYGIAAGFLTSFIGVIAGALIAFWLSRSIFRPMIEKFLARRRRLVALDEVLTRDRWRTVLLLRVSPVMPFSLTSYALGLSGIATRDYLIGTLGSLPALLGYVVIGTLGASTLTARSNGETAVHIVLLCIGGAATLALTWHLSRLLGRALKTEP